MRERVKVAVKSDEIVLRDPKTMERITTKGKVVVKDQYWLRRIKFGDCIVLDAPAKSDSKTKKKSEG